MCPKSGSNTVILLFVVSSSFEFWIDTQRAPTDLKHLTFDAADSITRARTNDTEVKPIA